MGENERGYVAGAGVRKSKGGLPCFGHKGASGLKCQHVVASHGIYSE